MLPILPAENAIRVGFRKETNPNGVVEARRRSGSGERFVDVRILLDLRHLLGVLDHAVFIDDDDRARHHSGKRTIGNLHAVVVTEGGTEYRTGHDVLDTFGCTEAAVSE